MMTTYTPPVEKMGDVTEIDAMLCGFQTRFTDEGDARQIIHDTRQFIARMATMLAEALAEVERLRGLQQPTPGAAYECGACGAQWYEGIQNDCGHHKNERDYFKPSPCRAFVRQPREARDE